MSQWVRYFNFSGPFVHYEKISDDVVRVYNMLSTHCLLHLTKDFVGVAQRVAERAKNVDRFEENNQPLFDIGIT